MPSFSVIAVGLTDPPPFEGKDVAAHIIGEALTLIVLNAGMASGQPSVMLVANTKAGLVIIETSLLALQAAARTAVGMAEVQFGWEMPP